jgi:hypothetical protein
VIGIEADPTGDEDDYVTARIEGNVCLRRDLRSVRLPGTATTPLSDLVHPVLATAGVMAAWARGEVVLHAGAFVGPAGAWIVLGDRGAGKSTLLAQQHVRGHEIVADDVCVIRADRVCAGPRTLDLRPDAAALLCLGLDNPVRDGQRCRVALPAISGEMPLAGFVELGWSREVDLRRVSPVERLKRLLAASGNNPDRPPAAILELAGFPYLRLQRAPTKESGESALRLLATALCGSGTGTTAV